MSSALGPNLRVNPWVEAESEPAPMTRALVPPIVFCAVMLRALIHWFTRSGFETDQRAPAEAIALRSLGVLYLALFIVGTVATHPHPGIHGKGSVILAAMVALVACVIASMVNIVRISARRRI